MRDWNSFVRARLHIRGLQRQQEIIEELADHLEEAESDGNQDGQVSDWPRFSGEIRRAEEDNVRSRLQTLWIPGLISGVLATMALAIMQKAGLRPLVTNWSGQPLTFYWPWLFMLPAIGAVAAYLSRRAGGSARARLAAAVFPCLGLLAPAMIGGILALVALLTSGEAALLAASTAQFIGIWVVLPAFFLALGALPLLGAQKPTIPDEDSTARA